MNTPATTFALFGIPMYRQSRRRALVVLTYIALALVCGLTCWFAQSGSGTFGFAIYAALGVGIFVFGGQGRRGLVKQFTSKAPSEQRDPIDRLVYQDPVLLRLAPLLPRPVESSSWKNDERELAQRDRAHYLAYQPLMLLFMLILLFASFALRPPAWISLRGALSLIFLLAMSASVLAITLPAAIILWTEPDIDIA